MTSDTIADLLTRIRNATLARQGQTKVPYSKVKTAILDVLKEKKFVEGYEITEDGSFKNIIVKLHPEREDIVLKRVSKPGQRIYVGFDEIKKVNAGMGISIISTSKGIMTGEKARNMKVGGEFLCEIY